jgi:hypothetical protein
MIGIHARILSSPCTLPKIESFKELAVSCKKCFASMVSRLRRSIYGILLSQRPLMVPLRKAQFERHFKQWVFQEHKKKDIWEVIVRQKAKRKRDEKETEMWTGHERISGKSLKKELARYGYEAAFSYGSQGNCQPGT